MANATKYKAAAVGHLFDHYGRATGDNVQRGNEKIQPELTHLNYDLHTGETADGERDRSRQRKFLQKRLSEVKHRDLAKYDDNLMVDWVITLPEDVPPEKAKEFFQHCYDFCSERYGSENVISAWVHMDETTPHMHFSFVPVVKSEDGTERLCAKERISKFELTKFHPTLQKYVEEKMGQEVGILNGATAGGNLTITELKMRTALEALAKAQADAQVVTDTQKIFAELQEMLEPIREQFQQLDKALKSKKFFGDDDKKKMGEVEKRLDALTEVVTLTGSMMQAVADMAQQIPESAGEQFRGFEKTLKEMNAKAERRLKREEKKLQRWADRLQQQQGDFDGEVQKVVQAILRKEQSKIEAMKQEQQRLQEDIQKKQQQLAEMQTDFWMHSEFTRQAQVRQQNFLNTIAEWSGNGAGKDATSIVR